MIIFMVDNAATVWNTEKDCRYYSASIVWTMEPVNI